MESGELSKIQVRKVAQDVLISVWSNQGLISTEQIRAPRLSFLPDITPEFVNDLCVVVRFQMYLNEFIWEGFLRNNLIRMTKTPYLFANYFAYASYILSKEAKNAYSCFVEILSLIIHFAHFCWQDTEDNKFINSCVDLFCAFFDKELCKKFEDQGMWKNFNECLKKEYYETILKRHNEVIHNKKSLTDALIEFRSSHNESKKPYIASDVLKNITTLQVEEDKRAISFADFVGDKMKEVCGKPFDEVLDDFRKIEKQVEELSNRETTGEDSGERTSAEYQSSSQQIQEEFENIHSKANPTKNKDQSKEIEAHKALEEVIKDFRKSDNPEEIASGDMENQSSSQETQKALGNIPSKNKLIKPCALIKENKASDPLETRDSSPAHKESVQTPYLTEKDINETKELLQEMLTDIQKISELFHFLCENKAF